MTDKELLKIATEQLEFSYSPYSNFKVGAALLTKTGKVYTGCNIENASFSPTVCAERTAFFKAISEGEREFCSIAIVGGNKECLPCGVCRQVMSEFCKPDFQIVTTGGRYTLGELMPKSFILDRE